MGGTRVLPWADWSEWNELRDMIHSGTTERAAKRVALYRLRRRDAVPIRMASTITLMRQLENPDPDPYLQRLALSMTLIRLVNGTTDQLQPRGERSIARSVYSLAVDLKLPLILVEIRHQASHNALPRLSVLKKAAEKALVWLEENYWEPQRKGISSALEGTATGIRKVFGAATDDMNYEILKNGPEEIASTAVTEGGYETPIHHSVLDRMRELSEKLECNAGNKKKTVPTQHRTTDRPRWALCNNHEAWRITPLGLVPGQTRFTHLVSVETRPQNSMEQESRGFIEMEQNETDENHPRIASATIRKRDGCESEADRPQKARKRFSAEEESYMARKKEEFNSLLQETQCSIGETIVPST
ncbi:unnamed protein product [Chondrus crispus]|uniref:Uncharacterized protein n=1 Tax=Chondrus crispus TaxID=2769 RepID=R7QAV5_CHOCR|nr:unnamed protein product [Chondrus crispus]CDF35642.1 unnamed protein product [Chondrus crispus]|eukprot:XP_005715461.1 unnamed protein product [Chondrus crispus]